MSEEIIVASSEDVILLGQILSGKQNQKAIDILDKIFGSSLSYTRGDTHHTAMKEGQKSVVQFIKGAVATARRKAEEPDE